MLLFVTSNDGSDMRINKEIKTLSRSSKVLFLGIGCATNCYVAPYCHSVVLVKGRRNSPFTILKLVFHFLKLSILEKIKSVHIINEQLYVFFYPFLFKKHTVLDLFDSIFLKKNLGGERLKGVKRILYLPANAIIVTDENRLNLMPSSVQKKCFVVPNYPKKFKPKVEKTTSEELRILYNGWMGLNRGTEIIEGLLRQNLPLKIIMAGWFSDAYTRDLINKYAENIEFLGVLPQEKALEIAYQKSDYILCVYAPINQNNINASPNKVYDAIHTSTPLIINAEVKVSTWIGELGVGHVLERYNVEDYEKLYYSLWSEREKYSFDEKLKEVFSWESVEGSLLEAHKIS